MRVFGAILAVAAFAVSSIAALILGIGLYFSLEGRGDPATWPLLTFGFPYALAAVFLGLSGLSALRKRTDWRGAILGSLGALALGAFLLLRWPFTRRNFAWLPMAFDGIWVIIVGASGALISFVVLMLVEGQLRPADRP